MRQSRYKSMDSYAFMGAMSDCLLKPGFDHIAELLRSIHRLHREASGSDKGFMFDDRFFPARAGVRYESVIDLHPSQHERMQDYLMLQHMMEQEAHQLMNWIRNMFARCTSWENVKANLPEEVTSVLLSDGKCQELGTVEARTETPYPLPDELRLLMLKLLGMRFLCS
ncbi:hypothetical protein [Pantoea eucrina]|uniref:hypothetical protein n=1 Tax=Pantoea eucrina TaxID=472693 RepID=UPI0011126663|nr:hypothetical protein [Pantoea eucrina]